MGSFNVGAILIDMLAAEVLAAAAEAANSSADIGVSVTAAPVELASVVKIETNSPSQSGATSYSGTRYGGGIGGNGDIYPI
jgi:hypothetical protein